MNKKRKDEDDDQLRPEYADFGQLLKEGVQGKYAKRYEEGTNIVVLAPDVARSFPSSDAVNEALRLVIQLRNLPDPAKASTTPTRKHEAQGRTSVSSGSS